jgi:teichoic acid transport system permease protein
MAAAVARSNRPVLEVDQAAAAYSDVEYVFEPHHYQLPPLGEYIESVWERRRFLVAFAKADLTGRSASTAFGRLWEIFDPIFQIAIYYFLYTVMAGGTARSSKFLVILIGCFFLFRLSLGALSDSANSIRRAKGLMLNSTFPRAILPLASMWKDLLEFVPALIIYVIVYFPLGGKVGPGFFLLPLLFVVQEATNIGAALLVATLIVYMKDMSQLMNYVNRLLLFSTPVIYPVTRLSPTLQAFLALNPFFGVFACYQRIFAGQAPRPSNVAEALIWSVVLLTAGVWVFLRHEREFAIHL